MSCSKVRRSVFSEILSVPIAVFGFLFNIANLYGSLCLLKSLNIRRKASIISGLYFWNAFGCLFVFYLIGAEIYLQTICPLCTIIHILQIITLIICYLLHFEIQKIPSFIETIKDLKNEI